MAEYSSAGTGEYSRIFPNFQTCACCEKYLKDNNHNSLHLEWKCARILVLGYYLFLKAHSFSRGTLSKNCLLLGTDNVLGQISLYIFTPSGGYYLYLAYCFHPSLPPSLTDRSPLFIMLLSCDSIICLYSSDITLNLPIELYQSKVFFRKHEIFSIFLICRGNCHIIVTITSMPPKYGAKTDPWAWRHCSHTIVLSL